MLRRGILMTYDRKIYDRKHSKDKYAEFKQRRLVVENSFGNKCALCETTNKGSGWNFHHKYYGIESNYPRDSKTMWVRWKRLKEAEEFPERFALLCCKCHMFVTFIKGKEHLIQKALKL